MGDLAPDGSPYTTEEGERFNTAFSLLALDITQQPPKDFSAFLIRTWHSILAKDIPRMLPGIFRTSQRVGFGRFKACDPEKVKDRLDILVRRIRNDLDQLDKFVEANGFNEEALNYLIHESSYLHAELVAIHPFMDGNGRVSRLCQIWMLSRYGLDAFPDFNDQEEYLLAINQYHVTGDYKPLATLSEKLIAISATTVAGYQD